MKLFTSIDKSDGRCTAAEVGQPWELRWGIEDMERGDCDIMDVGTPRKIVDDKPEPKGPHRLLAGLDPDHPDTDRAILRRMFHEDPEKFIAANGTAGINKLMDIAMKDDRPERYPPITDNAAWVEFAREVAKEVDKAESVNVVPTPALLLYSLVDCGFSLAKLGAALYFGSKAGKRNAP